MYKRGVRVGTVKRSECVGVEIGIEEGGEFRRVIGELRSSMIVGREIEEFRGERKLNLNKLSVY